MGKVPAKRHRTGEGEIVPRRFQQEKARREFFDVLWTLAPDALEALFEFNGAGGFPTAAESAQWQATYNLPDDWAHRATAIPPAAEEWFVDLGAASLYEGRERWRVTAQDGVTVKFPGQSPYVMRLGMIHNSDSYAVTMSHLLYRGDECDEWAADADIGEYDPRTDTEDQAVARIMPVLERRLRYALQSIEEQDNAGDTVKARLLPARQHFEWTVRYQVLNETYGRIAKDDGAERKTVSRAVGAVADLIGLTLRPPDTGDPQTGGRPRKTATRRSRVIAIPFESKT